MLRPVGPLFPYSVLATLVRYARDARPDSDYERFKSGRAHGLDEARILADVQARNARCILSDGSERFRTHGRFETDPTVDFVR